MSADNATSATPKIATSGLGLKKYILKPLLRAIEQSVPQRYFTTFYDATFPLYQQAMRRAYQVTSYARHRLKDPVAYARAKRVASVMPYSLVGAGGLEVTDWAARSLNVQGVAGDFAELGVARGGCAALLGMAAFAPGAPVRKLWLFDSYEGLPEPTEKDFLPDMSTTGDHVRPLPKGSCLGTLEDVQATLLCRFNLPRDKIEFVVGWFEDTVPVRREEIRALALLRIDGDWYESVKICLDQLYDKVSVGGIVIIDDYDSCIGAKRAVDEFVSDRKIETELVSDGRGGRWWRKAP